MPETQTTETPAPSEPAPGVPAPAARRRPLRSSLFLLVAARAREFAREPEAVFWTFGFPLLVTAALGIAFRVRGPDITRVAVEDGPAAVELRAALERTPLFAAEIVDERTARDRLRTGKVALTVEATGAGELRYHFDPDRPQSRLARALADDALQSAAGRRDPRPASAIASSEPGTRYVDFLVPGLIGMNLLSSSVWGIGWMIVYARSRKILKRFAATPMRRRDYLLAQMIARLLFAVVEVAVLLAFARLCFGVGVRGSLLAVAALALGGTLSFTGLGLLVASRARTNEAVGGLMNLITMPMFIFSGVFFASSNFPAVIQPVLRLLPLTALNDALRAVMIDGASLASLPGPIAVIAAWGLLSFAIALRVFRWS